MADCAAVCAARVSQIGLFSVALSFRRSGLAKRVRTLLLNLGSWVEDIPGEAAGVVLGPPGVVLGASWGRLGSFLEEHPQSFLGRLETSWGCPGGFLELLGASWELSAVLLEPRWEPPGAPGSFLGSSAMSSLASPSLSKPSFMMGLFSFVFVFLLEPVCMRRGTLTCSKHSLPFPSFAIIRSLVGSFARSFVPSLSALA